MLKQNYFCLTPTHRICLCLLLIQSKIFAFSVSKIPLKINNHSQNLIVFCLSHRNPTFVKYIQEIKSP